MSQHDFTIAGSQSSPSISSDWARGVLSLEGDSYPENAHELFKQVFDWIRRYLACLLYTSPSPRD